MKAPCKGCVMRMLGCHSWRDAYLGYKEHRNKELEEQAKRVRAYGDFKACKEHRIDSLKKYKHAKKG